MLHKLNWRKDLHYCNASRHRKKRRIAKWYSGDVYYCKHCAEQLWKAFRKPSQKLSSKHFKRNKKTVTARIAKLRKNATRAELIFRRKLKRAIKVKFKFQRGFIKGGYYAIVDFHIPSRSICIEIDGEYHSDPEQQRKDQYRDNWLETIRKQKVIRITNEQAIEMSIAEIREKVKK